MLYRICFWEPASHQPWPQHYKNTIPLSQNHCNHDYFSYLPDFLIPLPKPCTRVQYYTSMSVWIDGHRKQTNKQTNWPRIKREYFGNVYHNSLLCPQFGLSPASRKHGHKNSVTRERERERHLQSVFSSWTGRKWKLRKRGENSLENPWRHLPLLESIAVR